MMGELGRNKKRGSYFARITLTKDPNVTEQSGTFAVSIYKDIIYQYYLLGAIFFAVLAVCAYIGFSYINDRIFKRKDTENKIDYRDVITFVISFLVAALLIYIEI
jgi:O-antigen/teichoic acid export membrane protein